MANLRDIKRRITTVKSTQKITSAMKMVAAMKLRRAQEAIENARPYAVRMRSTLEEGKKDVSAVRQRLRVTYAVIVVFSLAMFVLAMSLVGYPARAFYRGEIDELTFGALAGAGGVVLRKIEIVGRDLRRAPQPGDRTFDDGDRGMLNDAENATTARVVGNELPDIGDEKVRHRSASLQPAATYR